MLSKNSEEIKLPLRNYDLQVMIVRYEVAYEEKKFKKIYSSFVLLWGH